MNRGGRLLLASVTANAILFSTTLLAAANQRESSYDRAADPHEFTVFMRDGGWCWYQDPRAIVHAGHLLVGGVQGNDSGDAVVGVFDLERKKPSERIVLHEGFKRDDHNCPVFYARPDGKVVAVYALHHGNKVHYYRISDANSVSKWGAEQRFKHTYPKAGNVTYMNVYELRKEGKIYNFFRGIEFNPCFITSSNNGDTWGEPTHFIQDELSGRQRPYARYTSNGSDTVHVSFTDAHPRQFGNSIFYAAFRDGNFYSADGALLKSLEKEGPLKPSDAERIYEGSAAGGRGRFLSAEQSAWTSSIELDKNGRPHIGYTLYLSNADHRYRVASWDGSKWTDREVAYGGNCLYGLESSYTGLITLDPTDPTHVLISTDVHPSTGASTGGKHEIYRAKIGLDDTTQTIIWKPLTKNSPVRNLRPIIAADKDHRVLLWLRGDFVSYTNYQLDVVGIVEEID